MKAIVCKRYGSPDVLQLQEVPKPTPGPRQVLVRVRAVSLNDWDWSYFTGKPRIYRLMSGLFRPKVQILGSDIAGTVEAVGTEVTRFAPGDEVFGDLSHRWGGFAEYVAANEQALTRKPASMSWTDAAAIPQARVRLSKKCRRPAGSNPWSIITAASDPIANASSLAQVET